MLEYKNLSDAELVDLLAQSDQRAFQTIFKRYSKLLLSFAYRHLDDWADAEDVVQEFFLSLWRRREEVKIEKGLQNFAFSVVKKKIIDKYRHETVANRFIDNFEPELYTQADATDYLVRYNDLSALIKKEIDALPDKMRRVFELRQNTDMSRREIAEYLNIPEATVRINVNRALKILRGRLGILIFLAVLGESIKKDILDDQMDYKQVVLELRFGSTQNRTGILIDNWKVTSNWGQEMSFA